MSEAATIPAASAAENPIRDQWPFQATDDFETGSETVDPQGLADRRMAGMVASFSLHISPRGAETGPTNTTFPKVVRVFGREGTTDALAD